MIEPGPERTLPVATGVTIEVDTINRSAFYAGYWLDQLGYRNPPSASRDRIVITGGSNGSHHTSAAAVIRLWDYQVGHAGSGVLASAVSGASAVIGHADGPGQMLPADIPEKWCGAYGVILALAEVWRLVCGVPGKAAAYDVSAADILRCFALQNAGDPAEIRRRWHRNGRLCVEHGGIFPMGFYACRDGHVALLGRSRRDWRNIRQAIGDPPWARSPRYQDPFALALDSAAADQHLERTLAAFDRDDLLARGLAAGAVIAPVYDQAEAVQRNIFRSGFADNGAPAMPFLADARPGARDAVSRRHRPAPVVHPELPLAGLRCIELCWVWSGPMTTQILADLGAEVVKVESADRFDLYRTRGLEHLRGAMDERIRIESSLYFHSLNRNKLGLTLDLKSAAGHAAMLQLVHQSDLLVENFTVGTLERLGLDGSVLAAANPAIVCLSMSGPGRGSAVQGLRSYGLVLSALAGAEAMIADDAGFLGSPTFSLSDPNAALFGAMSALIACLRVQGGGPACALDLSQIEAAATLAGTAGPENGTRDAILRTTDGADVAVSLPRHHYPDDAAMRTDLESRRLRDLLDHSHGLDGQVADLIDLEETGSAGIFAGSPAHVPSCHPVTGDELLVAAPWRINGGRPAPRKPAPLLGESNAYVLRQVLGLDESHCPASGPQPQEIPA